jgi:DNA gyrase subunit A
MAKRTRQRRSAPLLDAAEENDPNGGRQGPGVESVPLHEAAQSRYLNYALSVITARALPDVRDGLKPVQRRILYTMWQQRLTADAKPRKCAKVVGDVMGSYHPHGDTAIYDSLVRMAQPFALRYPLVEGSGNFGSIDGDSAAAMRYTECRLATPSAELLTELSSETVAFRPSYDGTQREPVVLPARLPTLLINGTTGIAVGMATNIPPHHLGEVCTALLKLLAKPDLSSASLCKYIKGPDFPTGGHLLNTAEELQQIYKSGSGTLRLRATWELGPTTRNTRTLYVTSVPYASNKSQIVERIADIIVTRKLGALLDVTDESTEDIRVALEIKGDADPQMVMAFLFKHTPLQTNFSVNMTCLVPTEQEDVARPERLDLHQVLWHFLHFRLEVVTRRLEHELAALQKRIHILEGFEKVFDALNVIIALIRASDGKADAAVKIMHRFKLDAEQTDAILELKIYRLARLEILVVQKELADKRSRARKLGGLLGKEERRWAIVRDEIRDIQKAYGDAKKNPRRTRIESVRDEPEFNDDDFIVEEDCVVLVSRDGWVKRQKEVRDLSTTRLREGDTFVAALSGSTRATAVFFSNFGVAYSARLVDIPASTGYGEPIQRLFKLKDGERVVSALSLDDRVTPGIVPSRSGGVPKTHAVAVSSDGFGLRFSIASYAEPSTRAGRRFARPSTGAEIVRVAPVHGKEVVIVATKQARAMLCKIRDINFLSGPGKGVTVIKLAKGADHVLGFVASDGDRDLLIVETSRGAQQTISTAKYEVTGRGGKGRELLQRGEFIRVVPRALEVAALEGL